MSRGSNKLIGYDDVPVHGQDVLFAYQSPSSPLSPLSPVHEDVCCESYCYENCDCNCHYLYEYELEKERERKERETYIPTQEDLDLIREEEEEARLAELEVLNKWYYENREQIAQAEKYVAEQLAKNKAQTDCWEDEVPAEDPKVVEERQKLLQKHMEYCVAKWEHEHPSSAITSEMTTAQKFDTYKKEIQAREEQKQLKQAQDRLKEISNNYKPHVKPVGINAQGKTQGKNQMAAFKESESYVGKRASRNANQPEIPGYVKKVPLKVVEVTEAQVDEVVDPEDDFDRTPFLQLKEPEQKKSRKNKKKTSWIDELEKKQVKEVQKVEETEAYKETEENVDEIDFAMDMLKARGFQEVQNRKAKQAKKVKEVKVQEEDVKEDVKEVVVPEVKRASVTFVSLCKHGDKCRYASTCRFAHTVDQVNRRICKYDGDCDFTGQVKPGVYSNLRERPCIFWHKDETPLSYYKRQGGDQLRLFLALQPAKPVAQAKPLVQTGYVAPVAPWLKNKK